MNKFDSLIANVFRKHWRKDGLGSTGNVYTTWAIPLDEREHTMGVAAPMASMPADSFAEHARAGLLSYEREVKDLNIILFPEVLDRVARFNRVLSQPGGHLLLAGRSGAGRRSTASLVAHMQHMEFFSPKMTLAYDERAFKVDLKRILAEVAVENKETLLFIEDHQLVTPAILETVNSLLSSGEVPGLFTQLELDQIFGPLKDRMLAEGTVMSPFDFFTARVKAGLHIALSMDPSDPEWPVTHGVEPRAVHPVLDALDVGVERGGHAGRAGDAAEGSFRVGGGIGRMRRRRRADVSHSKRRRRHAPTVRHVRGPVQADLRAEARGAHGTARPPRGGAAKAGGGCRSGLRPVHASHRAAEAPRGEADRGGRRAAAHHRGDVGRERAQEGG